MGLDVVISSCGYLKRKQENHRIDPVCQKSIANGILAGATQIFPQKETESFNLNKVDMGKAKLKTVKDRKPDSKEHH